MKMNLASHQFSNSAQRATLFGLCPTIFEVFVEYELFLNPLRLPTFSSLKLPTCMYIINEYKPKLYNLI